MTSAKPYEIIEEPALRAPWLLAAWGADAGNLGPRVVDYLIERLGGHVCAEIAPAPFFQLGGVSIRDNVIQFPASSFYCTPSKDLIILKSDVPTRDFYRFVSTVLDIANVHYGSKGIYTIGGLIAMRAHTRPGRVFSVVNLPEIRPYLSGYDVETGLDYKTPADSRPTLSSYLLWAAARRHLPGVSLWAEVPFYLAGSYDPRASRALLSLIDGRWRLGLDLAAIDSEIEEQDRAIGDLRREKPEVSKYLEMLERDIALGPEEQEKLVAEVSAQLAARK